jgi:hypothetical protein
MDSDIATVLKKKRNIDVLLAVLIVIVYTRIWHHFTGVSDSLVQEARALLPAVLALVEAAVCTISSTINKPGDALSSVSSGLCPYNRAYAL